MSPILIILIAGAGLLLIFLILLLLTFTKGDSPVRQQTAVNSNLRNLVLAQRERTAARSIGREVQVKDDNLAFVAAAEGELSRKHSASSSRMNLDKLLRFGKWPITPMQFRGVQVLSALLLFTPAYFHATLSLQILTVFFGFMIVKGLLRRSVRLRFEAFDRDYPVMLLSYVSLLKTGMSTIGGLEAAAKGLDEDSFVRAEVMLLVERLRLGLTEEQAINAFGQDVAHPELELFVQSLILSKRVGGTLSTTLERLAKQVRKRQEFRKKAVGAIALEKGSLYAVAGIMTVVLLFLTWRAPTLILPALYHPTGRKIMEFGLLIIALGYYWSQRISDIKV